MIEVEIRAKVDNLEDVKEKLDEFCASFIKTEKQVDRVFGHPMFLDSEIKIIEGGLSARIRQINDKAFLEFKEIIRKGGGIEVSSKLSKVDVGLKLLEKLKFEEAFIVSKLRQSFSYDGFEICLDNVDKLGMFIEIEKMVESSKEIDSAREGCVELLNKLSPSSKIIDKKYGDLMQDLINKKKKI